MLFGAVADRQPVRFRYHGGASPVDPWRLSFRNGQWYLAGWDHSRGGSRTFRLDRIESVPEFAGEPGSFERPPAGSAVPPPPWQLGVDDEVTATLLVDAGQAELGGYRRRCRRGGGAARRRERRALGAGDQPFRLPGVRARVLGPRPAAWARPPWSTTWSTGWSRWPQSAGPPR